MDKISLIPSHAIGVWLLSIIHKILDFFGLEHSPHLEDAVYILIVVALSLAIGWVVKKAVVWLMRKFVQMRKSEIGQEILDQKIITSCSHIIPPLVLLGLVPIAFESTNKGIGFFERLVGAYTIIAFGVGLTAIARFIFYRYNKYQNTKGLPLKGILNITLGVLWAVLVIISVAIVVDKSPAYLLTGLGAFAAALMLIFKDSILGFTAGIQMSQNDMLHVGDWIVVPGTPANGIVKDVTLSAVKIQNFDNTYVTVPPYTLVSTSFQNYRGMKVSGCRRFNRTLIIDYTTVVPLTQQIIDAVLKVHPEMKTFVDTVRASGKLIAADPGIRPLNGSLETNLGFFRAYCTNYLLNSPWVNSESQILVRVLDPTDNGLPLDIYAFAITTDWNEYEAIQSAIMEHFCTAMSEFQLGIFNEGAYDITLDSTTPGAKPQDLKMDPVPTYPDTPTPQTN